MSVLDSDPIQWELFGATIVLEGIEGICEGKDELYSMHGYMFSGSIATGYNGVR